MKAFNLVEAGARVCLLALIAICIPFGDVVRAEATNSTDTTSGPVVGLPADAKGVRAFLGIPYAEPPTGERRFRPPAPVKRSSTPIEATHFGNACAQRSDGEDPAEFGSFVDENCLTLNVWSPSDRGHLPVMVWIHGGGNSQGSSREPAYNGARLAARGKVVVVSLNYRLGIFGFVDISVLGGPRYKESCNDGLLDQLEALRWVKENIAGFGGDPGNVTVFGNSAGGVDISALLAMRSPEHFFHRAIIQSGFAGSVKSLAAARRFSGDIFGRAHVKSVAQLLAMTPEALLAMQAEALKAMSELESDGSFQASVDGTLLKEFPIDAIRKGSAKEIDLLLGTTANELRLYLTWNPEWKEAHLDDLPIVRDLPETTRNQLWNIYRKARPNMADGLVTLDILGDVVFRAGELRMAEEQLPFAIQSPGCLAVRSLSTDLSDW